jgi:hypothetical protein
MMTTFSVHVHFATSTNARCIATFDADHADDAMRLAREYTSDAKAVWVSSTMKPTTSNPTGQVITWVKKYAGGNR